MDEPEEYSPRSPEAENDPDIRMMTTERDQHVIVAPDRMPINPVDTAWITEQTAIHCRINVLGKCLSYCRFSETSKGGYRSLLLQLIAGGVRVIHKASLEEANARYLEIYPDAEGSRERRPKPFISWEAPFEINVPANTVCTRDIAWPPDAKEVWAEIEPMQDEGDDWGVGLALGWADGPYVQINARTDGRWGIRHNRDEYLFGSCTKGRRAIVAIDLGHKLVELRTDERQCYVAEFPRRSFPRVPAIVRVGKIGKTWEPRDSEEVGTTNPCRVNRLRIY